MDDTSPIARTVMVLTIWGAGLACAAQFAKISVVFEDVLAAYPGAGAAEGFLLSLISFVGVIFGVTGGAAVARLGSRRILVASLSLGAAVSAVQALFPPLPIMLGLRLIEGASHLGVVIAAPTLIAGLSEGRWQGAAMTLWGSFFGVSFALVAWAGVPLADALGVPALFLAHAAIMLIFALALWLMLPEIPRPQLANPPDPLGAHIQIYRSPSLAAPALGWLFYTLTFVSLLAVLPRFLDDAVRGWTLTLMPLAGIAVSMTLGVALLRVLPAVGVVILGFGTSAVLAGTLALTGVQPWLCIALFGTLGLIQGASFAAVPQLNARQDSRALANGAMAQMGNIGNLLGTPVLLWVILKADFSGLVWFAIAAYLLGALVHVAQAARRGFL